MRDQDAEAYRSPDVQRKAITDWAKQHDVTIGRVVVEEDVSGGKRIAERGLEKLLLRVEQGASQGVVVYETARFGRSLSENVLGAARLKDAGGRLVGVQDGVDTSTGTGELVLTVLSWLAEAYLRQVTATWANVTRTPSRRGST